jgi:hypothetical protein
MTAPPGVVEPVDARACDDPTLRDQGLRELVSEGRLAGSVDAVDGHPHPSHRDLGNATGDLPDQSTALRTHRPRVTRDVGRYRLLRRPASLGTSRNRQQVSTACR